MSAWNAAALEEPGVTSLVERLTPAIQEAFSRVGSIPGLNISLETANGIYYAVLSDGRPVTDERAGPPPDPRIKLRVDEGDGKLVHIAIHFGDAAQVNRGLVEELLHSMLQRLEAERREELLIEELGSNWESLEALYEISTDIQQSRNVKEALRRLIERLTSRHEMQAALYIAREGCLESLAGNESAPLSLDWDSTGPIQQAVRARRSLVWNATAADAVFASPAPMFRNAVALAAAPVTTSEAVLGFLVVWRNEGPEFDSPIVRHLEAVAYQVSVILEGDRLARAVRESELLAQEIEIASSIHKMLLIQEAPEAANGIEIAAFNQPSQRIDGDFHDFFQLNSSAVDVLVGDVMGKGVAAALVGAATKSQFLRAIAQLSLRRDAPAPSPSEIVEFAAKQLGGRLIALDRFVTLCYARFDATARRVSFVNCGHTSAILLRRQTGECSSLEGDNLPLGVVPSQTYREVAMDLLPGDTFLFYSDGVTEARNMDQEFFGEERLSECLRNWASLPPATLLERIRGEATRFSGSRTFADDFTCVAVKVRAAGGAPLRAHQQEFRCSLDQLPAVRDWLAQVAGTPPVGLCEERLNEMELALTEAFSNCVVHGMAKHDGYITATAALFPGHISVSLRHYGKPFAPAEVPPPSFDGSREGGFGVFIISRCVDELFYSRDQDGLNTVSLVKFFANPN